MSVSTAWIMEQRIMRIHGNAERYLVTLRKKMIKNDATNKNQSEMVRISPYFVK